MQTGYVGLLELNRYELSERNYEDEQVKELSVLCESIVIENDMSYVGKMKIDHLIESLNSGDTLIICSLKFLARNRDILYARIKAIEDNGIILNVMDMEEDTFSSHIKAIGAFNTYLSGMRVKKGAYKARHYKAYKVGRKLSVTVTERENIRQKRNVKIAGVKQPTITQLAEDYNCSRQTIYNILKGK